MWRPLGPRRPAGWGFTAGTRWAFDQLDAGETEPTCPRCRGLVKSATVRFGQDLFAGVVERALALVASADMVLAVGSSLQVRPAADIPAAAA